MSALAAALEDVLAVLDRLEIVFLIGGSVASGSHGLPRQTNDIDIVAAVSPTQATEFCYALQHAFYANAKTAADAVRSGRSFNVIHLKGAYKFDIFPAGDDPFVRSELARRRYTTGGGFGLEGIEFPVCSAEDTILAKLGWFRKDGAVSERQWHDILGVLQVQAVRLDRGYLEEWAKHLGVSDLLVSALAG